MAKILIVEDNQGTNKAICEYMKEAGHTLFSAFTGSEALKIFREKELDIIVLDIMLPEMSGIVVLHEIRKISNIDFPNCACPKCSCHEYISDKCRGEHFVRSRYAPAHYSNHVENISDFYTLLRRYIGIVFILLFQRHNHSDFIALKIRKSNVEIGARRKSDCIVKG